MSIKECYIHRLSEVIAKARALRFKATATAEDGAEVYAYPKPNGLIAWGINSAKTGSNVLRGIRRPDGADEAES